ncbi:helix-turn-helix domain-containing protein [Rahnella sp. PCH160]|uniref:helix-turn-helix domain-containing protein n=1 Tax=Rahnella sp. PCH160 TaxID=3447928 RepID=UPI0039FDD4D0
MNIEEIRRSNLQQLIDEFYDGKQVKLAEALGIRPNYISRLLSRSSEKKIGGSFCRKLESISGKPINWMDNPHGTEKILARENKDLCVRVVSENIANLMSKTPAFSTEAKLARAAEVSQSTIHRIINMETSASISNISSIARAFGLSPFELLLDRNDPRALLIDFNKYSLLSEEEKKGISIFIEFVLSQSYASSVDKNKN